MNLFTIPVDLPFVEVLAGHILNEHGANPAELSKLLVLLPSRRACRSLTDALLRLTDGKPMILPRIRPLGDVDEEELFVERMVSALPIVNATIPDAVTPMQRLMLLTREVWDVAAAEDTTRISMEQALFLAAELGRLLDEVAREELSFDRLNDLVPMEADYAEHWQKVLRFLHIITTRWPELLAEKNKTDSITRRGLLIDALSEVFDKNLLLIPVIAAGSTGSIPAVARLLKRIAQMPKGKVILPGLEPGLSDELFDHMDETHPYYGQKRLLKSFEVSPAEIKLLAECSTKKGNQERKALFEAVFTPAALHSMNLTYPAHALAGIRRYDCATSQEEASLISIILRDVLETPQKTAALVTSDRTLARTVAAQCERFGIHIDDSAGEPLAKRPAASFMRLLLRAVAEKFSPLSLLALLKHPLCKAEQERTQVLEAARELDLQQFRNLELSAKTKHSLKAMAIAAPSENTKQILQHIEALLAPLQTCWNKPAEFTGLLAAHIEAAQALAGDALWVGEDGTQLREFLDGLLEAGTSIGIIKPYYYPGMFDELLGCETYRPPYGSHPRLHILSPMEARLTHFDLAIAAGLNEGSWPPDIQADPWMSRPMRQTFGLPAPERIIGQASHDFLSLIASSELVLTRANKVGGTPTVPCRWLPMLEALVTASFGNKDILYCDQTYPTWQAALDQPQEVTRISPPAPKPPVSSRPRKLSVTKIETLMKNPYAVYASHILKLKKLEPLDKEPDHLDFGNIIHAALDAFVKRYPATLDAEAYHYLLECGRKSFIPYQEHEIIRAFWWPRFERIAQWFIQQEEARRLPITQVQSEQSVNWQFTTTAGVFTVHGKLDRLEVNERSASIGDYKTGSVPSKTDVASGLACQLPLLAVMVEMQRHGLITVDELEYWSLKTREQDLAVDTVINKKSGDTIIRTLIDEAKEGVLLLIKTFDDENQPYLSCPHPGHAPRHNDYEHLARNAEWSVYEDA